MFFSFKQTFDYFLLAKTIKVKKLKIKDQAIIETNPIQSGYLEKSQLRVRMHRILLTGSV